MAGQIAHQMLRLVPLAAITSASPRSLCPPWPPTSCYDYAWESPDMKDCLAGKPMHHNMRAMHSHMHERGKHGHMMKHMSRHDVPVNKS